MSEGCCLVHSEWVSELSVDGVRSRASESGVMSQSEFVSHRFFNCRYVGVEGGEKGGNRVKINLEQSDENGLL